ncbi:HNH endonuclease signature motif containing protein [Clostridioides sp. ZZV14-6105]|uniref:HNH endonuclease n=1 Tax=Clostridioides sp. ZZV14-6105 TaxID=2811492 RepID=UPI001D1201FC|nr:HNH endonuclease [Clostridioides sp. ZZV14-6105]
MKSHNLSELLMYIEILDEGKYSIDEVLANVPTITSEIELKELVKFIKQNEFISKVINKYIVFTNSKLCLYKYDGLKKAKEKKQSQITYEELRQEFTRKSFRTELKIRLGCTCSNCDSTENIEYHHIVPLATGGTNKFSNIVPLCVTCHEKAHDKKRIKVQGGGSPKATTFPDAEPILKMYFRLEIGTKEAKELIGISINNKSTWTKLTNQYREKYNIDKDFRNNIDLLEAQKNRVETLKRSRASS